MSTLHKYKSIVQDKLQGIHIESIVTGRHVIKPRLIFDSALASVLHEAAVSQNLTFAEGVDYKDIGFITNNYEDSSIVDYCSEDLNILFNSSTNKLIFFPVFNAYYSISTLYTLMNPNDQLVVKWFLSFWPFANETEDVDFFEQIVMPELQDLTYFKKPVIHDYAILRDRYNMTAIRKLAKKNVDFEHYPAAIEAIINASEFWAEVSIETPSLETMKAFLNSTDNLSKESKLFLHFAIANYEYMMCYRHLTSHLDRGMSTVLCHWETEKFIDPWSREQEEHSFTACDFILLSTNNNLSDYLYYRKALDSLYEFLRMIWF